ncbi:GT4 family glycosyltransferase PelF [Endozoicomonas sp. SCSIO W0465]|uniref:GT4 family glycosyltransferase PelF n=1 Tax=Endozoicomonas sp. SCSIO W0465 TaxID=2918516 RepID=UPI0020752507|nr:GT4 family glycosyltransferase PelF [Endozoicomonas sp. SCSIO W0465]USE39186.1 GT4 family glycosyltransferase PelF [Endozoicomonas sp. SCSIO W0465]
MNQQTVDVLFLLEGTYPFVRGGVSSWIHEMIKASPEIRFGIMFIGGSPEQNTVQYYQLPDNVVYFTTWFLSQSAGQNPDRVATADPDTFEGVEAFHHQLKAWHPADGSPDIMPWVCQALSTGDHLNHGSFLHSHHAMNMVNELYREYSTEASYLTEVTQLTALSAAPTKLSALPYRFWL